MRNITRPYGGLTEEELRNLWMHLTTIVEPSNLEKFFKKKIFQAYADQLFDEMVIIEIGGEFINPKKILSRLVRCKTPIKEESISQRTIIAISTNMSGSGNLPFKERTPKFGKIKGLRKIFLLQDTKNDEAIENILLSICSKESIEIFRKQFKNRLAALQKSEKKREELRGIVLAACIKKTIAIFRKEFEIRSAALESFDKLRSLKKKQKRPFNYFFRWIFSLCMLACFPQIDDQIDFDSILNGLLSQR